MDYVSMTRNYFAKATQKEIPSTSFRGVLKRPTEAEPGLVGNGIPPMPVEPPKLLPPTPASADSRDFLA
jgi:hypothetical protein